MQLQKTQHQLTISSVDFAISCGKKHFHVLRDINILIEQSGNPSVDSQTKPFNPLESTYKNRGKDYKCYLLTLEEATFVASGYSPAFRQAVAHEFAERRLESAVKEHNLPLTYTQALECLLEKHKDVERLTSVVEQKNQIIEECVFDANKRTTKKALRQTINNLIKRRARQTGENYNTEWRYFYGKLMEQCAVTWKREFFDAPNKLDFLSKKGINYLKLLRDAIAGEMGTDSLANDIEFLPPVERS